MTIWHKFPVEMKVFGVIQPPSEHNMKEKLGLDIRVINPKNPDIFCDVKLIEVLHFDILGEMNYFPDWLSLILFGRIADPILGHILQKYPEAKRQNCFELWIVKKI